MRIMKVFVLARGLNREAVIITIKRNQLHAFSFFWRGFVSSKVKRIAPKRMKREERVKFMGVKGREKREYFSI